MAPRGPRAQGGRAERDSRGAPAPIPRSSNRGGIQKKRSGGRTDVDGDLDMDGGAKRPRNTAPNAGPSNPRSRPPARGGSRVAQTVLKHLGNGDPARLASRVSGGRNAPRRGPTPSTELTWLRVHGLRQSKAAGNPDGGLGDLLSFLERKASSFASSGSGGKRQVTIKKSHKAGDYVFIGASKEDAKELIKVNTFQFASTTLEVVESSEDLETPTKALESRETQELRAKLQTILSQRYHGGNKLLQLDSLATDPELVALGMFETRERALKTFKGLMAICDGLFKTAQEKREAVESVSLAGNSIDDVVQVEALATSFPQLKNLDLSNNQIGSMEALQRWRGKLRELDTIFIQGNPIEGSDPNLQAALLDFFPRLRNINGVEVRTAQQIAEREVASKPKAIPQSGPDFRDVHGIGEQFLLQFFSTYDSDRHGLASRLYDEDSQFSLAVDAISVRNPDAPPPLPWAAYLKFSRNLVRITHQNAKTQRLFKGGNVIAELWKELPMTKHPDIKEALSKYIMDCHPLPGLVDPSGQAAAGVDGLIIAVHGEFEEYDQKTGVSGKRSFSRTFILGPGRPGREAIRVVSDMLSLRAYSTLPNVFVAAAAASSTASSTAASAATPAQAASDEASRRQAMIAELCKQTGMVAQYSQMCLEQVEWDFGKALVIFDEKKAQLPPDAFAARP